MKDVTLYVRVMFMLGIENLVLTNAAGGINTDLSPATLCSSPTIFSLFCQNPLFGKSDERFSPRFPSMSEAYSKESALVAEKAASRLGIPLKREYIATLGPT